MNTTDTPAKIREMASELTDEALSLTWMTTETATYTPEIGLLRSWLQEELFDRLGEDLFDEWVVDFDENDRGADPMKYFTQLPEAGRRR
jgi:hypothetical protein